MPALMFHSVGLEDHPWAWSQISEPFETFEAKIALLKRSGFSGVFWHELYEHMAGRRVLPDNSILLTFDDGYLDNWVYVFPILKKYGMRGTIFVSPDFVDPLEEVRPNLDDALAGRCGPDELSVPGFLNWAEMREMEKSGLIDIQSHAMTHTWYFTGPKIVGFHEPHDVAPLPWLFWNVRPDRKPYYLTEDQQHFLPWGSPIFEHGKSLSAIRFFPETNALNQVTDFVELHGGSTFFLRPEWRSEITSFIANAFEGGKIPGIYESEDARASRVLHELQQSKELIESNLGKQVEFICWPGGANSESVHTLARAVG